ncbi:hypothetical protein HPP92_001838 [Vanilla planifolia]|uniref:Uncharacterized protein n=1 Tax=Vanilla planifolia TaxID=51239 RepID=A0A835S516_VANPL|nr:hypothetical protein HPP92_001838 [Vanilla planifolia]
MLRGSFWVAVNRSEYHPLRVNTINSRNVRVLLLPERPRAVIGFLVSFCLDGVVDNASVLAGERSNCGSLNCLRSITTSALVIHACIKSDKLSLKFGLNESFMANVLSHELSEHAFFKFVGWKIVPDVQQLIDA